MEGLDPPTVARLAGAISALVLAGLLARLVFSRRPLDVHAHWLLVIGAFLGPAFVLLVGATYGMEASKEVESCNGCHVMQPFVADLRDRASTGLAAVHYNNRLIQDHQCFACHVDYAPFGGLGAKLRGVGHVVRYVTGRYEQPIPHRGPYPVATCQHCHGESTRFQAREEHQDLDLSTVETCFLCHELPHPIPQAASHAAKLAAEAADEPAAEPAAGGERTP